MKGHLLNKSQRGLLPLFCSTTTFMLGTKKKSSWFNLLWDQLPQTGSDGPTKERQFLNTSFSPPSLQLNCSELRSLTEYEPGQHHNGTPPSKWLGSSPILQQWIASKFQPVRSGRCWVFAAVLCSGTVLLQPLILRAGAHLQLPQHSASLPSR